MTPAPDRRLRIMLLFGGQSAEHDVSRVSAVAVARALDPARYDVVPVAITREGRWLLADRARAALESGQFPPAFDVDGAPVRLAEKRAGLGSAVVRLESGGNPLGAVDVALRFDEWILVEEAISGREIEVAVLGDRPPEASLPGEIVPGADFYTYEDKYLDDSAELRAPTDLDPDRTAEVRRLAVAAFDACRCEAM